jgi:hypothetical protein
VRSHADGRSGITFGYVLAGTLTADTNTAAAAVSNTTTDADPLPSDEWWSPWRVPFLVQSAVLTLFALGSFFVPSALYDVGDGDEAAPPKSPADGRQVELARHVSTAESSADAPTDHDTAAGEAAVEAGAVEEPEATLPNVGSTGSVDSLAMAVDHSNEPKSSLDAADATGAPTRGRRASFQHRWNVLSSERASQIVLGVSLAFTRHVSLDMGTHMPPPAETREERAKSADEPPMPRITEPPAQSARDRAISAPLPTAFRANAGASKPPGTTTRTRRASGGFTSVSVHEAHAPTPQTKSATSSRRSITSFLDLFSDPEGAHTARAELCSQPCRPVLADKHARGR